MANIKILYFAMPLLLFASSIYGQKTIQISGCKKCNGVIINKKPEILIKDFQTEFIPTNEKIQSSEKLITNYLNSGQPPFKKKGLCRIKSLIRHSHRQYFGYIDNNKDSLILSQFLDFRAKDFEYYFENWRENFIAGSGDYYYKNSIKFRINLSKKEVSIW